jgi:formamidopyrimidine-DNA glycosylase
VPELPEVETVRRDLVRALTGAVIASVTVTGRRTIRRQSAVEFTDALAGRTILGCRRHGKYLLVDLDDQRVLVIHLRMSGQLRYEPDPQSPLVTHTHVVIDLVGGAQLRFVDPRTFGEMFVADDLDERGVPVELAGLGLDPLEHGVDPSTLAGLLARRRTALKAFLLDQSAIAGIGNIYGDEICFAAKLRPDRRTDSLSKAEVRRLSGAITDILAEAVELRGSTLRDARYRDVSGGEGGFQSHHFVYAREGKACLRCGRSIERTRIAGRSTHFCTKCQR